MRCAEDPAGRDPQVCRGLRAALRGSEQARVGTGPAPICLASGLGQNPPARLPVDRGCCRTGRAAAPHMHTQRFALPVEKSYMERAAPPALHLGKHAGRDMT